MALIRKMEKIEKARNSIHDEVESTYTVFIDPSGKKMIQIDTYGSPDRKIRGKVSQSIQLDRESAQNLVKIISNIFSN